MPLDVTVATVMVRKEQALIRDYLARTAASEKDDGILEGSLVDTINVLCGKFETLRLHIGYALGDQGRQPHAFVGPKGLNGSEKKGQEEKFSFHGGCFLVSLTKLIKICLIFARHY
jgi:hypothetical protein